MAENSLMPDLISLSDIGARQARHSASDYHENSQGIVEEIHSFSLNDNSLKAAQQVE